MRRFKDILSLITEAKFEPGGPDVGKLFGKRGKYAPEKGQKEKTAKQRMKSGELTPNVNRPSGLETTLGTHPPENAQFIEPPANQRAKGKRIIDRFITPHHPGIPFEVEAKPKPKAKSQKVVLFTNNVHHNIIGTNNKKILEMLQEIYPEFVEHSDRLTKEHASNISNDSTEYSRRRSAHGVVDSHFSNLKKQIIESSKNGVLPNGKKFGPTKIKQFSTSHDFPGTKTMTIQFEPLKTHVQSSEEIDSLLDHLLDHTGHEWYLHADSGNYMVGKNSSLVLATDINHPDLGDPDDDKRNEPETPKPPKSGGRAPTRPRMPSLV